MKRKISEVKARLTRALKSRGLSLIDSSIIAEEYLSGELQGKFSHGLMAFPSLLKSIDKPFKPPKIIKRTHSFLFIEANKSPGVVVGKFAVEKLVKMAGKEGIAAAFIKDMTTWLRPGTIARFITDNNMVGLVFNNGSQLMTAPPGGFEPVIGTNPIGISIPTKGSPIIADMASSKRAWGEVRQAKIEGRDLIKDTFYTKSGEFAKNPDDAYSVVPMGDYKGFALGFLIEVLAGSFMGRQMGSTQQSGDYRTMTRGGVIIVLNPKMTTDIEKFKEANSKLVNMIKKSKKLKGVSEILLPGERSTRIYNSNIKQGSIEVSDELWEQLK